MNRVLIAQTPAFFALLALAAGLAHGAQLKPIELLDDGTDHDKYAPAADIVRHFKAFTVSFDSKDDDDGDRQSDVRRIPEWVAQQLKRTGAHCVSTTERPNSWMTDKALYASGVAPNDASYANSGFDRGHMAAKLLAARLGPDTEWNTHTVLNAVPQRARFNRQIWRDLEELTGAWAQIYGNVWIIQGPVFDRGTDVRWIGDGNEYKVAVPDALFKIVVRDKTEETKGAAPLDRANEPEVLAFLYPQLGPRYYGPKTDFEHKRYLTTVKEIEDLTQLTFFQGCTDCRLSSRSLDRLRNSRATMLWPTTPLEDQEVKVFVRACPKVSE